MQRKGFFLLALICGLIAAGSMYTYLNGATRGAPVALKPLVIVKSNIPARSVIVASQLEVKDVPELGYPQGGFSTIQNVVGSVTLLNLSTGDLVVGAMLERSNSIPDGKRAVAIPIGLVSGVGNAVKPGDHVDILVTMEIKDSTETAVIATTLAAQDVLVLSIGGGITGDKAAIETKSYTLALSVPQAMAVTFGSEKGSLRLLLRNPKNSEIRQDAPVSGKMFLDPNYYDTYK